MFMQNFYQATCSGSWVIVLTAKTLAENNTVATIADEKRVTEPNWHGLVFDELVNRQAVMNYSRHRRMASVSTWLCAHTCQPMTNGLGLVGYWSVCQKLNHVTSVQFSSVPLHRSVRALITLMKAQWLRLPLRLMMTLLLSDFSMQPNGDWSGGFVSNDKRQEIIFID